LWVRIPPGTQYFKNSRTQELKNSRTQELKNSRTQELKNSRTQELKNSRTQELKNSKYRGCRIWGMIEMDRDPAFGEVKEKLKRLNIEAILFDLDDTLIYTSEIFILFMEKYSRVVGEKIGVGAMEMMLALQAINDEEYKTMGVNPKRWEAVVEKLVVKFSHGKKEILENLDILKTIYAVEPRMRTGVRTMLEILKESGIKLGLVTHANVEWTEFKLNRLGLWDYFDQVIIVDENGHKKADDWERGMERMEVEPEKCLVVGDSLGGDVRPGDELGARTIYLPSPWSVYRHGEVPGKTVVISEIFELLAALDRLE